MRTRIQTARIDLLPLAGASVVVTRPTASAIGLLRRVRVLGGAAIALPGVALRPSEEPAAAMTALKRARSANLVIFVSPAAVQFAWRLYPGLAFPKSVLVAGVGAATASALRRHGVVNVLEPATRQDSEGLLQRPQLQAMRGWQAVLVGAAGGRDSLPQTLIRRGARVTQANVYQRVAPRWNRVHLARLVAAAHPRLWLLSSAQALAQLATALPAGLVLALRADDLVVSSTRLADLAHEHGCRRVHVANSANALDMIAAAVATLARHRL